MSERGRGRDEGGRSGCYGSQAGLGRPAEIIAELSCGREPERLWGAASLKLSQLLDVPNCDVYRVGEGEDLVCITSVCEGEWYVGYLGRRAKASLWATDREALRTRRPVLISSPDDPRLDESERAQMPEVAVAAGGSAAHST